MPRNLQYSHHSQPANDQRVHELESNWRGSLEQRGSYELAYDNAALDAGECHRELAMASDILHSGDDHHSRGKFCNVYADDCGPGHLPRPSFVFTIEAREGDRSPWSSPIVGSARLIVDVDTRAQSPPSISLASSRASYRIGETVGLVVNANVPIGYWLSVRKPDNATLASWYEFLREFARLSRYFPEKAM